MFILGVVGCFLVAGYSNAVNIDILTVEEYPYYASVESMGIEVGAAAIVDRDWVITSSGLCSDDTPVKLRIRVGTDARDWGVIKSLGQGGSVHQIVKTIKHLDKNWLEKPYINSVCLMKVKEPFEFDETRQRVTLPEPGDKLAPGTRANLTGFSLMRVGNYNQFVQNLQSVGMHIFDTDKCIEALESKLGKINPEGKICASYYVYPKVGKAFCWWNLIGGLLTIEGLLVGLVSYINCDEPNNSVIFTDIAYYRDWIDQHLK